MPIRVTYHPEIAQQFGWSPYAESQMNMIARQAEEDINLFGDPSVRWKTALAWNQYLFSTQQERADRFGVPLTKIQEEDRQRVENSLDYLDFLVRNARFSVDFPWFQVVRVED